MRDAINAIRRDASRHDAAAAQDGAIVGRQIEELVLGLFATMIVMYFSRQREFRADAGGAKLAGREQMIGALERLQQRHAGPLPDRMAAFGISGGVASGLKRLFMTHPPLEERIAMLRRSAG